MYTFLIFTHSWNRWFVLLAFVVGLILLCQGLFKKSSLSKAELISQKVFVGLIDLQFMLGLGLMAVTPLISGGGVHPWIYHHGGGMFVAVFVIHAANSIAKKKETAQQQRRTYLIGNLLGFLIIFGSIPWPFMSFARPLFRL